MAISLGFDASTTCCGFAFTEDDKILSCGFIDISKVGGNRAKAAYIIDFLKKHTLTPKVEQVNLEASLGGFSGPASRKVIVLLARWNAIFQFVLEDYFNLPVNLVGAMTARKQVFGKGKIKGVKPKIFVKEELDRRYDMTPWLVYNKLKNPDKKNEDTYDAVVISLFKIKKI